MTTPHKCPCCDGRGEREPRPGTGWPEHFKPCTACNRTGIVWEPEVVAATNARLFVGASASIESCTVDPPLADPVGALGGYPIHSWYELQSAARAITNEMDPAKQAQGLRDRVWRMKVPT